MEKLFIKKIIILRVIFFGVLITSCSKADDFVPENLQFNIGSYSLLSESVQKMPYLGKSKAIFIDSSGYEIEFEIIEKDLNVHEKRYTVNDLESPTGVTEYIFNTESKTIIIQNDSIDAIFSFRLTAAPYWLDPLSKAVADLLLVSWDSYEKQETVHISYNLIYYYVAPRTYPKYNNAPIIEEVEVMGKKYENVIISDSFQNISIISINFDFGLLSFIDRDGKLWGLKELM